jgi:urocanate hydratase
MFTSAFSDGAGGGVGVGFAEEATTVVVDDATNERTDDDEDESIMIVTFGT